LYNKARDMSKFRVVFASIDANEVRSAVDGITSSVSFMVEVAKGGWI
jgi:hypothetical protein